MYYVLIFLITINSSTYIIYSFNNYIYFFSVWLSTSVQKPVFRVLCSMVSVSCNMPKKKWVQERVQYNILETLSIWKMCISKKLVKNIRKIPHRNNQNGKWSHGSQGFFILPADSSLKSWNNKSRITRHWLKSIHLQTSRSKMTYTVYTAWFTTRKYHWNYS